MESLLPHRGFTLTEMLVVLAIIVTITGVALSSQSSFNKTLIVSNTAYDIALTLRAAETYGIGSRAAGATNNAGYGLEFDRATRNQITLFSDSYPAASTASVCHPTSDAASPAAKPGNCAYDASQGERVTTYTIGNGITVSDFCVQIAGTWSCASSGAHSKLDIIFARPNPEPLMSVDGSYPSDQNFRVTQACLVVSSPQGGSRYVSVSAAGQITASATSCP